MEKREQKFSKFCKVPFCSRDGLRTLCLGVKEVQEEEYKAWAKKWREATTTLVDREEVSIYITFCSLFCTLYFASPVCNSLSPGH